jgi:hypothetical protein
VDNTEKCIRPQRRCRCSVPHGALFEEYVIYFSSVRPGLVSDPGGAWPAARNLVMINPFTARSYPIPAESAYLKND